jgi:hypothetical protein
VRVAKESGGVVRPAGAAKCLMGAMGHLLCEAGKCSARAVDREDNTWAGFATSPP